MSLDFLTYYSDCAIKALLYELQLSPKPGLVDRFNAGAHKDMSFSTFIDSTLALAPFFAQYIETGWQYFEQQPQQIFQQLRQIGLSAEKAMYEATEGVNTHKGANFSFALLLGATGIYLRQNSHKDMSLISYFSCKDTEAICRIAGQLSCHLLQTDFLTLESKNNLTYGERLFVDYGIAGPRGEAASGFSTLIQKSLPFLRKEVTIHSDKDYLQLRLLLYLMTFIEDGNLIHRGGIEAWRQVKHETSVFFNKKMAKTELIDALTDYDNCLIKRHLSPGGAADLLALTLYFAFLEKQL